MPQPGGGRIIGAVDWEFWVRRVTEHATEGAIGCACETACSRTSNKRVRPSFTVLHKPEAVKDSSPQAPTMHFQSHPAKPASMSIKPCTPSPARASPDLGGLLEEKEAVSRARLRGLLLAEWPGSSALADTQWRTHRPPALPLLLSARSSPA